MSSIARNLVRLVLLVVSILMVARIIVSWADPAAGNALSSAVVRSTDTLLAPLRSVLPATGSFDPAPILVLVVALVLLRVASTWGRRSRGGPRRRIRVIGIGGGGSNAIDHMIQQDLQGVDFIACNTDSQAILQSTAPTRIRIGGRFTRGLGTGGDVALGQRAAEEDAEKIREALRDSDMVFITAGLGGGTGSGASPIVASIAKDLGALTIGIVTKPFTFEGAARRQVADRAAEELKSKVDTLIVIQNDRIREVVPRDTAVGEAFRVVDDVLRQAVQGITDVITMPGLINLDFADIRSIIQDAGSALMGIGRASGPSRAVEAARQATESPMVGVSVAGARGILFNITGSANLSLHEMADAAEEVRLAAHPDANIIFGACVDDRMGDDVQVTVIATGFDAALAALPPGGPAGQAAPGWEAAAAAGALAWSASPEPAPLLVEPANGTAEAVVEGAPSTGLVGPGTADATSEDSPPADFPPVIDIPPSDIAPVDITAPAGAPPAIDIPAPIDAPPPIDIRAPADTILPSDVPTLGDVPALAETPPGTMPPATEVADAPAGRA
jgi:cell division protein FtsZ